MSNNLCKKCAFRFRRVFSPGKMEEYTDEEGNLVVAGEDNIVIINTCILTGMDIESESTIECSHFKPKSKGVDNDINLFKHI